MLGDRELYALSGSINVNKVKTGLRCGLVGTEDNFFSFFFGGMGGGEGGGSSTIILLILRRVTYKVGRKREIPEKTT